MQGSQVTNSIVFSSSRYVLVGLSALRNIVIARYLGPEDYGLWIIILLVLSYSDQIHLGLRHAGDREIPFFRGQGKMREAVKIMETLYSGILYLSGAAVIVLLIYTFLSGDADSRLLTGIQIATIIIFTDQINKFYLMVIRARKQFILSSKIETIFEVIRTILVCALVLFVGLYGILAAYIIAGLFNMLYYLFIYDRSIIPGFDARIFSRGIKVGFPLFVSGLMYLLIISLDRVIGASILSKEILGIYGFAALTAQLPVTSSQAIGMVFYPEMSEKLGETKDTSSLLPYFKKVTMTVAYIGPLLVVSIVCISELLISWVLPAYGDSVPIIYLLSNGVFFLAITPIPLMVLMASGRPKYYLRAQIISIMLASVIYVSILVFAAEPETLAVGAALSYVGYTLILLLVTNILFRIRSVAALTDIITIVFPCIYGAILLTFVYRVDSILQMPINLSFEMIVLMRLGIFLVFYAPMLIFIIRKFNLFNKLTSKTEKE